MRQPHLIAGESGGSFQPAPVRTRSSQMVRILVFAWLLAGLGFALWKFGVSRDKPIEIPAPTPKAAVTVISGEDLLHHASAVNANLNQAAARLRRSEDQISRSIPGIDRNYLFVEKQHLQNALAATEAARRDLEQARQDSDLILNSLKEHETK